jgi:uncharacterized repeat protein (TIGR03803 family)
MAGLKDSIKDRLARYRQIRLSVTGRKSGLSGVIFDSFGNLYGTTQQGGAGDCGSGCGVVYKLAPSGGSWTESVLHYFAGDPDGALPIAGLIFDQAGNLYGATTSGGYHGGNCYTEGCGTVFQLSPSGGGWAYSLLYTFTESGSRPNGGPAASLTMDASGNLYGTTVADGPNGAGSVFKLTHSPSGWTYTSLHDFTAGSDGGNPWSTVTFDANGNMYGMTSTGGTYNKGVIWQITP